MSYCALPVFMFVELVVEPVWPEAAVVLVVELVWLAPVEEPSDVAPGKHAMGVEGHAMLPGMVHIMPPGAPPDIPVGAPAGAPPPPGPQPPPCGPAKAAPASNTVTERTAANPVIFFKIHFLLLGFQPVLGA